MILLTLALLQTTPAVPAIDADPEEARYERCTALVASAPDAAVAEAGTWRIAGGGLRARQCLGLAYAAQGKWAAAATSFEQAAREAEASHDPRVATLWAQTGNARLAGGDAKGARSALDAALARPALEGVARGEAHLDRARALVAAGDLAGARSDLDNALELVPADPLGWLLSASQARRTGDLTRAQKDIAEALRLSADDAQVRLEAGNIAALTGNEAEAKAQWTAATTVQPSSPAAASARTALAQFEAAP